MSYYPKVLGTSAEYAAKAEDYAAKANEALTDSGVSENLGIAQVYAMLAQAAATVEAGVQVADVGPALESVARELRDGLDQIARAGAR